MSNQRFTILLIVAAVLMVGVVFGALHLAGRFSEAADVPQVAMSKGDVEKIVRNYLLENPQVIFEAVERFQSRETEDRVAAMKDGIKKHATALYKEAEPIVAGNPNGDVTIVEFFDYRCPYCKKVKK